jgi:hypothetical protein
MHRQQMHLTKMLGLLLGLYLPSPNWHPWNNLGEDLGMQIAVFTGNKKIWKEK